MDGVGSEGAVGLLATMVVLVELLLVAASVLQVACGKSISKICPTVIPKLFGQRPLQALALMSRLKIGGVQDDKECCGSSRRAW